MKGDQKYTCELCNFGTNLKTDFTRHLNTKKHIKITKLSQPYCINVNFVIENLKVSRVNVVMNFIAVKIIQRN